MHTSGPQSLLMCLPLIVQNYALVKEVELLASKKGVTPGQLALAWVHSQGDDVFPIPGRAHLLHGSACESEGLGAVGHQELLMSSPIRARPATALMELQRRELHLLRARKVVSLALVPAAAREASCATAPKLHRYIFYLLCPVARLEVGFCLPQQTWRKGGLRNWVPPALFVLAPRLEGMPRRVCLSFACLYKMGCQAASCSEYVARLLHHLCTVGFPACITCEQPWCSTQLACAVCSGTKREKYLTENVKAFHVKLTSEDKAALEAIFHQDKVTACFRLGRPVRLLGAVQDNVNA